MELTLTQARKRILHFIALADEYNAWRKEAKSKLLSDIAPRLDAVGKKMYMGCGFHYGLEQWLGKLLIAMALPWQPSLNHYRNLLDDEVKSMTTKIIYEDLVKKLEEAETSAKDLTPE